MSIQTYGYDVTLSSLLEDAAYTGACLKANPLTASLAAPFDAFQIEWVKVNTQEIQLRIGIVEGNAAVAAADDDIDLLVDAVSNTALLLCKNDRAAPLYQLYFGAKRPSDLRKPVLGAELETVRGWIPSLKASADAPLSDLGERIEKAVVVADIAVQKRAAAEQKNRDFRTIGERKALVDQANALRKATYGKLAEMPHANPALQLPRSFADQFFRHDTSKQAKAPTSADLDEAIAAKKAELAALEAQRAAVKAQEDAEAAAKAEAEARKQALDAARKAAAEALARVAALEAQGDKNE